MDSCVVLYSTTPVRTRAETVRPHSTCESSRAPHVRTCTVCTCSGTCIYATYWMQRNEWWMRAVVHSIQFGAQHRTSHSTPVPCLMPLPLHYILEYLLFLSLYALCFMGSIPYSKGVQMAFESSKIRKFKLLSNFLRNWFFKFMNKTKRDMGSHSNYKYYSIITPGHMNL